VSAGHRVHRKARQPECLEVASSSSLTDLQFGSDLRGRDLLSLLQEQEDSHESIGAHDASMSQQPGQEVATFDATVTS
jgi:hypothetical protein